MHKRRIPGGTLWGTYLQRRTWRSQLQSIYSFYYNNSSVSKLGGCEIWLTKHMFMLLSVRKPKEWDRTLQYLLYSDGRWSLLFYPTKYIFLILAVALHYFLSLPRILSQLMIFATKKVSQNIMKLTEFRRNFSEISF